MRMYNYYFPSGFRFSIIVIPHTSDLSKNCGNVWIRNYNTAEEEVFRLICKTQTRFDILIVP